MACEPGACLATSATVLFATMTLALSWALGEATGLPHLSLTWMVATHGVTNAFGFALCGVVAGRPTRRLSYALLASCPSAWTSW